MADTKITGLTALAEAPNASDLLVLVDVSDTTMDAAGTNKKITFSNLTSGLGGGGENGVEVSSTSTVTLNPATHPHGTVFHGPVSSSGISLQLPLIASQPDPGYQFFIVNTDSGSPATISLLTADASLVLNGTYMMLTFLGGSLWAVLYHDGMSVSYTVVTNVDP